MRDAVDKHKLDKDDMKEKIFSYFRFVFISSLILIISCFFYYLLMKYVVYDPMDVGDMTREAARLKERKQYSQALFMYYKAWIFYTEGEPIGDIDDGLIECLIVKKQYGLARYHMKDGLTAINPNSTYFIMAQTYLAQGDLKKSREIFNRIIRDDKSSAKMKEACRKYVNDIDQGKYNNKSNKVEWIHDPWKHFDLS